MTTHATHPDDYLEPGLNPDDPNRPLRRPSSRPSNPRPGNPTGPLELAEPEEPNVGGALRCGTRDRGPSPHRPSHRPDHLENPRRPEPHRVRAEGPTGATNRAPRRHSAGEGLHRIGHGRPSATGLVGVEGLEPPTSSL